MINTEAKSELLKQIQVAEPSNTTNMAEKSEAINDFIDNQIKIIYY